MMGPIQCGKAQRLRPFRAASFKKQCLGFHWRLVAAFGLASLFGCPSSMGRIVNPPLEASVQSEEWIYFLDAEERLVRMRLNASRSEHLHPPGLALEDLSPDGNQLVLRDQEADLYVGPAGGPFSRVFELDGRVGEAKMAPDGRTVAVIRVPEASFSGFVKESPGALVFVDVASARVELSPPAFALQQRWVFLAWAPASDGVWVRGIEEGASEAHFSYPEGVRTETSFERAHLGDHYPFEPRVECGEQSIRFRGFKGDEGIDLVHDDGTERRLVQIEGRQRGFHDHLSTIDAGFFSSDCNYVVFAYDRQIWVAEVASSRVKLWRDGSNPFVTPRHDATSK